MALPDALASSLSGIQANFRELDKRLLQFITDAGTRFARKNTKGDLPASVAYEDEANTFTVSPQRIDDNDFTGQRIELDATNLLSFGAQDGSYLAYSDGASWIAQTGTGASTRQTAISAEDGVTSQVTASTSPVFRGKASGDAHPRIEIRADGLVLAGDGTGPPGPSNFAVLNFIQQQDDLLDAITALSMIDNRIIVGTGADAVELWTVTDFVKTLLDDANAAAARTTILTGTPAARATRTGVQTITTATNTVIAFDAEDYDTAAMHDTVTNNSRITVPVAGIYAIATSVRWVANSTGERRLRILKNGAAVNVNDRRTAATAPTTSDIAIYTELSLAATDYIEAEVLQASGGNLDLANPTLSVRWVGPAP